MMSLRGALATKQSRRDCFVVLAMTLLLGGKAMALEITSTAFQNGQDIPAQYTCEGSDASPPLSWNGAPAQTKSFALIMDDPDAPMGTWVHWVVYDIPSTDSGLEAGVPKSKTLPSGAKQGITSFRSIGYGGPCPPPGPKHRYLFKLYALDSTLGLPPGKSKADVERAMKGHVLADAQLMGLYGR